MYLKLTIMYFREQTIKSQTRIKHMYTNQAYVHYPLILSTSSAVHMCHIFFFGGEHVFQAWQIFTCITFSFFFLSRRRRLLHLITCIRNSKTIDLPTTWERFPVTWYSSSPSRWRCASSASAPSSDSLDNKMRVSRNDEALSSTSHHRGWYAPYACPSGVHATCNVHFVARRVRVSDSVSSAGVMWHVK